MNRIVELMHDALEEEDYKFRINFLVAGMMSAESNDTPDKIKANIEYLKDICEYAIKYSGDADRAEFLLRTARRIADYISGFVVD